MEENNNELAQLYQAHLGLIADSFLADTGDEQRQACLFFSGFKEWSENLSELRKQALAAELGYAKYSQLLNSLQNILFDYVLRCWEGELAPTLLAILVYLDREKGEFAQHLEELVSRPSQNRKLEGYWAEARKGYKEGLLPPFQIDFNIPYSGEYSTEAQKFDFYRPRSAAKGEIFPLILYFHGGAWAYGSRFKGVKRLRHLADSGYAVASCGYRLIREAAWPAQIEDCHAVLEYVIENDSELGIDPSCIIVWGSSSGAHLGGLLSGQATVNKVKGFVDMCGPMDVESHVEIVQGAMRELSPVMQLLGGDGPELKANAAQANVMNCVSEQFPSSYIVHGEVDDTVPITESEKLHEALSLCGVSSELIRIAECRHRMDDTLVVPKISGFLERMKI